MRFDLPRMAARKGLRRKLVTFATIKSTQAQTEDLQMIYKRMLAPLFGAKLRIESLYARELERKLSHDSPDELGGLADLIADEINRLVLQLTPDLLDWALRVEKVHRGKWARTIQSLLDITAETMLGPEDMRETLEAFLTRNTSLIRDVGEQARGRIADAVLRGIQQRTPTAKVAKEIAEAAGMARKRARRIASHQSVALNSALNEERRRQAGLDTWKWRHSGKLHFRPLHKARDGKLYTDETAPGDKPGELPNCGCVSVAVLVLDGEIL